MELFCGSLVLLFLTFLLGLLWLRKKEGIPPESFPYSHVLVTGGSSGIGKATAKEAIRRGARTVSLWARNIDKLQAAKDEIMKETGGNVNIFSVDVTGDLSVVQSVFQSTIRQGGDARMVIHCAGSSLSGTLEDTSMDDFEYMMRVNYFGSVNVAKSVLPHLKKPGAPPSRLTFVSSVAGVMGLYGYTAYSSSKFALRGFAESLEMEVRPYGVSITLSLPPDTDTPSFAEENKSKPAETRLLSESGGLFQPCDVAKGILEDTLSGAFLSTVGLDGWLLKCICFGMSPTDVTTMVIQTFTVGPLRFVAWLYTQYFAHVVAKCFSQKQRN